ncbi:D-inositol 3-phosphate glycosyltransferase [Phycisphaerales bacterium]|nr:D-inositol 3-phosphate glycosyltransferase [Phycisphaerales bacterium]
MRVLLFNIYFHPDPTGTGLVMGQLAQDLRAAGHEVTVVTTVPHYGLDEVPIAYRGRVLVREEWEGIRVIRTGVYLPRRKSFFSRILNYLSYMVLAAPAALREKRQDVVVCVWPPVTTGIAAGIVSWLRGMPLVMNVQDVYPDSLFRWKIVARANRMLERLILHGAARVAVLSEGLNREVIARGAREDRVRVIPMWTDVEGVTPGPKENAFRERHGLAGKFVVLYAGNLGTFSGVGVVLEAAAILKDDPRIRFLIVGRGHARERLLRQAEALGLSNTAFLDTRPREELGEMLAAADVSVVTLDPKLATTNVPSKAFTIMASGRPVLAAMSASNEISRIVEEARCGWRVSPENPGDLAEVIRSALGNSEELMRMGQRGRAFVEANHRRADLTTRHALVMAESINP